MEPCLAPEVIGKPRLTLLGLPLEIRELVWKEFLACTWVYEKMEDYVADYDRHGDDRSLSIVRADRGVRPFNDRASPTNILTTSRQIHHEVHRIMWSQFQFHFLRIDSARRFFHRLREPCRVQIRSFELNLDHCGEDQASICAFIRSRLPNLLSVRFRIQRASLLKSKSSPYLEMLLAQMRPFRDIENFRVKFCDYLMIHESGLVESGRFKADLKVRKGGLASDSSWEERLVDDLLEMVARNIKFGSIDDLRLRHIR